MKERETSSGSFTGIKHNLKLLLTVCRFLFAIVTISMYLWSLRRDTRWFQAPFHWSWASGICRRSRALFYNSISYRVHAISSGWGNVSSVFCSRFRSRFRHSEKTYHATDQQSMDPINAHFGGFLRKTAVHLTRNVTNVIFETNFCCVTGGAILQGLWAKKHNPKAQKGRM